MRTPPDTASTLARAEVLLDLDRYEQAAHLLSAHLAGGPEDGDALRLLAMARLGLEDLNGALVCAREAARVDPQDDQVWLVLSVCLAVNGRGRESRAAAECAVRLDVLAWGNRVQLARLLSASGRHRAAQRQAREAVRLGPEEPTAFCCLGDVAQARNRYLASSRAYAQALTLDPTDAEAAAGLGTVKARTGRLGTALQLYLRSAALHPTSSAAPGHVQQTLWHLVQRIVPVLVLLWLLTLWICSLGSPSPDPWSTAISWLVQLGAMSLCLRWARRLPPAASQVLRRRVVRSPWGVLATGLIGITGLILLTLPLLPPNARASVGFIVPLLAVMLYLIGQAGASRSGHEPR